MCKGYGSGFVCLMSVRLCACLSVCLLPRNLLHASFIRRSKTRYRVLYGVFKVFVMSKVLASFADCHCFPHFLIGFQWTERTAVA